MPIDTDDINDSVFLGNNNNNNNNHHRTPPDLSPLMNTSRTPPAHTLHATKKPNFDSNRSSEEINSDDDFRLIPKSSLSSTKTSLHRNRYFCFEDASIIIQSNKDASGSFSVPNSNSIVHKSAKKNEKVLNSPNLSPIRQDEAANQQTSLSKKVGSGSSSKKNAPLLGSQHENEANMSAVAENKSIIFMDVNPHHHNQHDQKEASGNDVQHRLRYFNNLI